MIESFKHLEEAGRDRDLADVFLETDAQEHGVPAADILAALRKRREVMRDWRRDPRQNEKRRQGEAHLGVERHEYCRPARDAHGRTSGNRRSQQRSVCDLCR